MTRWKIADEKKEKEIQGIMADIVTPIVVGQPSADVVEVVRCRDCKYKNRYFTACCKLDGLEAINLDSFCSKGERKETNE